MDRICYECNKPLTVEEAAQGQQVLEWVELEAIEQDIDFEGWAHCRGEKAEFIQEEDTELKELLNKMDISFYEDTIHVCEKCVREAAAQEGITIGGKVKR